MKIETAIATNRFGLGARPGELQRVGNNYQEWLLEQIAPPPNPIAASGNVPASARVLTDVQELRRKERAARRADPDVERRYGKTLRDHYSQQVLLRYQSAATSDKPFHERLVHFWANHFAVSVDKRVLLPIAGLHEQEAIRPHVTGNFFELLRAAVQHPAMILYLDNQRSIGPGSTVGRRSRRRNRDAGLNENLAREILELHTLGVNGGYTQQDVTAFARVITGWSVGGVKEKGRFADGAPGQFQFRAQIHEPGPQTVLGKRFAQEGVAQGEAVLRDLAVHPATARFIAEKLARHFVADEPPAAVVERLAQAFIKSSGDLPAVYKALVAAPEAWHATARKYKTPHDFVISAYRAFDYAPRNARRLIASLDTLGQAPFKPGSPEGWPDTADHWGGANGLYKRIEWADRVAQIAGRRVNPLAIGEQALGPAFQPRTRSSIAGAESVLQGTTLLLASPDFLRR